MYKKLRVETNKVVATDSPDHIVPWGTANDNSYNLAFNRKLMWWIPASKLRVLDLGCSGGGFVKSILNRTAFAVGIEGSDYSKLKKRAEWATIPDNLFTADITERFQVLGVDNDKQEKLVKFNLITAWEVIEHIEKSKLGSVLENISNHLMPNGMVIMSVSPNEDIINGVRLHQTVESRQWWIDKFHEYGFVHHGQCVSYFGNDWVREESNAPGSFHLVMTKINEHLPNEWRLKFLIHFLIPFREIAVKIKRKLIK